MDFVESALARLASIESCGYHAGSEPATEPTALAALAQMAHAQHRSARSRLEWLLARQAADGSVGIDVEDSTPGWGTGWAVIAWKAAAGTSLADSRFERAVGRALDWIVRLEGSTSEPIAEVKHDTAIKGWPWVEGTHAWVEPTAMNLLALRHTGHERHSRARDAIRLLHDRLLPDGGCNYGNTIVFGQQLRPHLQPTGLCLTALAGEPDRDGLVHQAIDYAKRDLGPRTTTESLSYALVGLAAHGHLPQKANEWLAAATRRTLARDPAAYKLALLALAAQGQACLLIPRLYSVKT